MTGRDLYERFRHVSTYGLDWDEIHEMDRLGWDTLAAEQDATVREAASSAVHWVANEITDAWERREGRRAGA